MAQKPSIPKGTRDFSPEEVAKRQYIIGIMKTNFQKFGYQPIETPSFENSDTLMGKYGEEGDRLIFKILDSGDYLNTVDEILFQKVYIDSVINIDFFKNFYKLYIEGVLEDLISFEDKVSEKQAEFILSRFGEYFDTIKQTLENAHFQEYWKEYLRNVFDNKDSLRAISRAVINIVWKMKIAGIHNDMWKSDINRLTISLVSKKDVLNLSSYISPKISEKALRYDLTVPFARYVVQHQNEIQFPFKRYQIQPVWRADRPQKGRFREFYQCDADVVGSDSLWQEVELVQLYDSVFTDLQLEGATIKINNRKILSGIAEVIGAKDKLIDFTVALDKLDKIGEEGVKKEMTEKGISAEALVKVQPLFGFKGDFSEKLEQLSVLLSTSDEGKKGIEELRFVYENIAAVGLQSSTLDLDVTLARGLNYYTGAIFEVVAPKVAMGSIGGGGRYDDLTGIFGLKNMSGVGISFGLDRIYLVLEELGLFPETVTSSPRALFLNLGDEETKYAIKAVAKLRNEGIRIDLYPDNAKPAKQFTYAEKRNIPYVVTIGEEELLTGNYTLKNLVSGKKETVGFNELRDTLSDGFTL